jgi:type I restriction enzyme S subunit
MSDAIDITPAQRKTLETYFVRYIPGVSVWAYGSRVKWTARPNSDLDLVVFSKPEQSASVAELKDAFAESDLPFRVDLHVWDEVPERFREIISREYVVLISGNSYIPPGWRSSVWGDEVSLEYGKALRGYDTAMGKYRVYGSNGPIGWTDKPLVNSAGVILGRKGAYRGVEYSPAPFFVIDTAYYVVPKNELELRWLYYAIKHHKLGEIDDGSPIPSTTRAAVYVRPLCVPPSDEQKAIARILGALDDKIELNRRMNETLERMAQALFKSWFVDFDPVRAKSEGRQPAGMDVTTADLFPDSFQDSELGPIPAGWRVGTIADVGMNVREGVSVSNLKAGTPYIALEHMPKHCIALGDWGDSGSVESQKFRFAKGDILFGKLRPYFHKIGFACVDGICSTDILVIKPVVNEWHGFLLFHLFSDELVKFSNRAPIGTRMPRTSWDDIGSYEVAIPPANLAGEFLRVIQETLCLIERNIFNSRTLATLRDTLLPKLLSGEISVADVELACNNDCQTVDSGRWSPTSSA